MDPLRVFSFNGGQVGSYVMATKLKPKYTKKVFGVVLLGDAAILINPKFLNKLGNQGFPFKKIILL